MPSLHRWVRRTRLDSLCGQAKLIPGTAPRTRAPLGMKTTNAKAKAFQTPAPPPADNDLGKTNQKSVSARKAKPRISHAEMTKLEVLGDADVLEEREIEYMPPRAKGWYLDSDRVRVALMGFRSTRLSRRPRRTQFFHVRRRKPDARGLEPFYD